MDKKFDLTEAETAFTEQVLKDFRAIGEAAKGDGIDELDRFYQIRFSALFGVMDAHLNKMGLPMERRENGFAKVRDIASQCLSAAVAHARKQMETKTDG